MHAWRLQQLPRPARVAVGEQRQPRPRRHDREFGEGGHRGRRVVLDEQQAVARGLVGDERVDVVLNLGAVDGVVAEGGVDSGGVGAEKAVGRGAGFGQGCRRRRGTNRVAAVDGKRRAASSNCISVLY